MGDPLCEVYQPNAAVPSNFLRQKVSLSRQRIYAAFREGEEFCDLKHELIARLRGLEDRETGEVAIREVVDTAVAFPGPYLDSGPDLLVGYNTGYRAAWDCASGRVSATVFEDNTRRWSGDHCIDPRLVPGVFLCNRAINRASPHIQDIAPTVLKLFGVDIPSYMKGEPFLPEEKATDE